MNGGECELGQEEELKKLVLERETTKTSHFGKQPNQENQHGIHHGGQDDQLGTLNVQLCQWITLVLNLTSMAADMT